jgi:plasmid maintenance system antidote protein VapI
MPLRYESSEAFTAAALGALKDDKRTQAWLAREAGIAPSTLWSQLVEDPDRLTFKNALRIGSVLDLDPAGVA